MNEATSQSGEKLSVEDITGETARKDRMVHFEQMYENNKINNQGENQKGISKTKTYPKPIMKAPRASSSFELTKQDIDVNNQRLTKSAVVRTSPDVSKEQSWSRTDFARKFNARYYNDERSDLYDKLSLKSSYSPQRSYVTTSLLN